MLKEKAQIMDAKSMGRAVARISFEILERNKGTEDIGIVGIMSRGVQLAQRIAQKIAEVEGQHEEAIRPGVDPRLEGQEIPVGYVDITAYRDDNRQDDAEDRTDIPFPVDRKKLILVDDVMFTGRSARAAIDAIMSRGRPQNIQLAVLVDRGHRELPIRADYIGKNLPTSREETVKVLVQERDGEDKVIILEEE